LSQTRRSIGRKVVIVIFRFLVTGYKGEELVGDNNADEHECCDEWNG